MSSRVAIWSFGDQAAVREVRSKLEAAGIGCSLLSTHDSIGANWLFVSREQTRLARETVKRLPIPILHGSVEVTSISEADIPIFAEQFGKRYRRRWICWLLILLWPVGFGLGLWWVAVSLLVLSVIVIVAYKTTLVCPCCRKPMMNAAKLNDSVKCSYCGIKSLQPTA